MKKLVFGIFIVLIVSSCRGNRQNNKNDSSKIQVKAAIAPPEPNSLTLNGIKYSDANKMITDFEKDPGVYDETHLANIWFSSTEFQNIYASLGKIPNVTGMRIYFARKGNQNTIIMVGTYTGDDTKTHEFFAPADQNAVEINGDAHSDNAYGGALLYDNPPCSKDDGCGVDAHYLSCEKAYLMVTNYGKDVIISTSEFYKIDVIKGLSEILKKSIFDGVRIYYARDLHPIQYNNKDLYRHGFVFVTTEKGSSTTIHKDHFDCKTFNKFFDIKDNGEQCPNNCYGATWP